MGEGQSKQEQFMQKYGQQQKQQVQQKVVQAPVKQQKKELYNIKIIFLDCDGVLNCSTNSFKAGSKDMFNEKDEYPIEQELFDNLVEIIRQTGAKIVISSTWREINAAYYKLKRALRTKNLEYIGETPRLTDFKYDRTDEISKWMKDYLKQEKDARITQWIAIDDLPLDKFKPDFMKGHYVGTTMKDGLTKELAQYAIQLLNNPLPP